MARASRVGSSLPWNENSSSARVWTDWLEQHPFPDPAGWAPISDPEERLRVALRELYAWYREAEQMMANFFRYGPSVPALHERSAHSRGHLRASPEVLKLAALTADRMPEALHELRDHLSDRR